jgi:1-deoxy-D-xylulose-5-phosphate synthase
MFNKIVMTHFYNEHRGQIVDFIKRMPGGETFARFGHKVEESVKGLILPGIFFEELGFRYLGPIDGHDLDVLIPAITKIKNLKGPIVLHVVTVKGKGRTYSESDPIKWHSPPLNFNTETGEAPPPKPSPPAYSNVFVDALAEIARDDSKVVAISAAMLEGTALTGFQEQFPDRTYDVGIAEEHAVISAAGMACEGLRPFVCIYSTFLQRAIDPIIHDVAIQHLPVVFSLDRAGLVGADGPTHHGVFDLSYLRMIPGMVLMAPKDARELRHMTFTAHQYKDGPIALRFPRGKATGDFDAKEPMKALPIGKGEILREGEGVCLIGIGNMAAEAEKAAKLLEGEGLRVGVVNARFVKPLDRQLLADIASRYPHLITIEDNVKAGGFGSAVNEALLELGIPRQAMVLGVPDEFITHGSQDKLHDLCGISAAAIAEKVRSVNQNNSEVPQRKSTSRRTAEKVKEIFAAATGGTKKS